MYYPSYLFSINEDQTRRNIREYDRRREAWFKKAEEMFPDYWKRNLLERIRELNPQVDAEIGYRV
ncbi:MAG: hypothetical protein IIZ93_04045 [Acidaminococcaceae bacterium]|nr:hypothetical protein [Acidaminococcaceae bacterium]